MQVKAVRVITASGSLLLILAVLLIGLLWGAVPFSAAAVLASLTDLTAPGGNIIRDLRLPRVLAAFGVGGALAVSGAALQALVRNPLAEPWLLGLSGGASLGAVVAITIGLPAAWSVAAAATIGALVTAGLVYRLALVAGGYLDTRILILAGVVTSAFSGALTTAILSVVDPFTFRAATFWLFGGFTGVSWSGLRIFAMIAVLPLAGLWGLARSLDLLALGEEPAAMLGADVARLRRLIVPITSILTAASVGISGMIGFVGLVVPHAMRGLVGPLHRRLLPVVFLAGGAFTVLADTIARTVVRPAEIPVGVVTALIGVPVFAILLRRVR